MNSLPSKEDVLAFQDRWLRPAGAAGVLGALVVAASIVLQRAGLHLPSGNSNADQLAFVHAHAGRIVYTSILQGFGIALFLFPLLFVFRSAGYRTERVRRAFAGLVVLGPLAFGIGLAVSAVGSTKAADKFVKQEPAVVQHARQQAEAAQAPAPAPVKKGKAAATTTTKTTGTTTTATGTTTTATGTTTTAAKPKTPDQAASSAREDLADHLNKHTAVLIVGELISTIGVFGLLFGLIYTNLWAMRTGLLSRFFGALGMAFGLVQLIPLVPPLPALVLYFAILGLMLVGFWPRPLPPAWAAGEAVPWQRPGDDVGPPPGGPGGTVEGSGREVSETPLPENGQPDQPPEPPYGETQGQRRKKRKRRS
ncbi:MAG TPA: hypothetical protein VLW53_17540 [Candidatus Eisenbacteria bacterium]|nr:hypothetical protein [Candidatus Eisenbacteria bacterium]